MKGNGRKILSMLLSLALVATMIAPATAFAASTVKMKKGATASAIVYSDSSTQKSVKLKAVGKQAKWKSSKKKVATVNAKGKVTAKKPGKTLVTAKTNKGTFKCSVTVKKVSINKKTASLAVGATETLKLNGEAIKSAKSSNAAVASVTNKGAVTGVSQGNATITLTGKNKKTYTCEVAVTGSSDNATQSTGATSTPASGADSGSNTGTTPDNNSSNAGDTPSSDGSNSTGGDSGSSSSSSSNDDNSSSSSSSDDNSASSSSSSSSSDDNNGSSSSSSSSDDNSSSSSSSSSEEDPSGKTVTVGTQSALNNALNTSTPYETIILSTQESKIDISSAKDLSSTTLVVDAPKASVSNSVKFKAVKIENIAKDTYTERADNSIEVEAPESHIVIAEDASAEVVADDSVQDMILENDGTVESLDLDTDGNIEITGTSAQENIPTTVRKQATISTVASLFIEALAKAVLYLQPGSEGTAVNADDTSLAPETFGLGSVKMTITSEDDKTIYNITIIAAPSDQVSEGVVNIEKVQGTVVNSAAEPIVGAHAYLVNYDADYDVAHFTEDDATKYVSLASNADGVFTFPNVLAGNYNVVVVADGYENAMQSLYLNNVEGASYCPDIVMLTPAEKAASAKGSISGSIVDSAKMENAGVEGITLRVRSGQNNLTGTPVATAKSSSDGSYMIEGLNAGMYTIEVTDERNAETSYTDTYFNVLVAADKNTIVAPTGLSTVLEQGQVRFVLSWGDASGFRSIDLDANLVGPANASDDDYPHVFYGNKAYDQKGVQASLDRDASAWDALETITLSKSNGGVFDFYVHNGSDAISASSSELAKSNAKVSVYSGARLLQVFNVPSDLEGTLWNVCSYDSSTGALTPNNTMTYEDNAYAIGSDRVNGDLAIKEIEVDGKLVTSEKHTSSSVLLTATGRLEVDADGSMPGVQVTTVDPTAAVEFEKYEWGDDDSAIYLYITSEDGRQRSYNVYETPNDSIRVNGIKTNEVVRDAIIHDNAFNFSSYNDASIDSNYIDLKVTNEDFEAYKDKIEPAIFPAGASYEVKQVDDWRTVLSVTSGDFTRDYRLYTTKDWDGLEVESIMAKSSAISNVSLRGDTIQVRGTLEKLEESMFDDLFAVTYGSRVTSHEFEVNTWDEYSSSMYLRLTSADGETHSYYVEYDRNWGDLAIRSIGTPDEDETIDWAYPDTNNGSSCIRIYMNNAAFTEEVFNELSFEYETSGVTGKLVKDDTEYVCVISKTGSSDQRPYRILVTTNYAKDFAIESVSTDSDFTYAFVGYDEVWLEGKRADFADLKDTALDSFEFGDGVASSKIVYDETAQSYRLVLSAESGLQREYALHYEIAYEYDFRQAYVDVSGTKGDSNAIAYTGSEIGAEQLDLNVFFQDYDNELELGKDYEVRYQSYDKTTGSYGPAYKDAPTEIGSYRIVVTSLNGLDGEATYDYGIVAQNSLKLCYAICNGNLVLNATNPLSVEVTVYSTTSYDDLDKADYTWRLEDEAGNSIKPADITTRGKYYVVVEPANRKYLDSIRTEVYVDDTLSLEDAYIDMKYDYEYSAGMDLPTPVVRSAGDWDGEPLSEACYSLTYYKWDPEYGYVECDSASIGSYMVKIEGNSPYYGEIRRSFAIVSELDGENADQEIDGRTDHWTDGRDVATSEDSTTSSSRYAIGYASL